MRKFTINELRAVFGGISYNGADKKVDALVKKIKEGALTGEIRREEEFVNGRTTKVVYISEDLFNTLSSQYSLTNFNSFNPTENTLNELNEGEISQNLTSEINSSTIEKMLNELIDSKNKIAEYAEKVGENKLLEANLIEKKANEEFYKNEYFKIKHENDVKITEINKLKILNKLFLISLIILFVLFAASFVIAEQTRLKESEKMSKTIKELIQNAPEIENKKLQKSPQ